MKPGYITLRLLYALPMLAAAGAIAYIVLAGSDLTFRAMLVAPTTIERLFRGPNAYDGKIVRVDGVVVGSFGIMGMGGFRLQEPNSRREILVVTTGGIPPAGNSILVFGRFKQAVSIGGYQYAVIFQDF